jgi:NAD(P)H-flavin reductase/hemoglobin-like flavoprotein
MAIGLSGFTQDGRGDLRVARSAAGHSGGAADVTQHTGEAGGGAERLAQEIPGSLEAGDPAPAQPDSRLLKKSLAQLEPQSAKAMAFFFATLFIRHPELRRMFPTTLAAHGQRVFAVLARYAWTSDRPETLVGWLSELGREHRKFGVAESHFRPFCDALLSALAAFGGEPAAGPAQAAWRGALDHIGALMAEAVRDVQHQPAWWLAEVIGHERPCPGIAVLTLRPDQPLPYRAGQHVSVQVPRWPRVWREYSVANAPSPDGLLRLHVRAVPCGLVSTVLVHQSAPGDILIIGPARGLMTVDGVTRPGAAHAGPAQAGIAEDGAAGTGDVPVGGTVACFAGGTGLAPLKAIVEELTGAGSGSPVPSIRLFVGARQRAGLYDLPALRRLAAECPSLTLIPVVSDDPGYEGIRGTLAEAAAVHLPPGTGHVFVSGPPAMVTATAEAAAARAPGAVIHFDPLPGAAPAEPVGRAEPPRGTGPAQLPWQPQG